MEKKDEMGEHNGMEGEGKNGNGEDYTRDNEGVQVSAISGKRRPPKIMKFIGN